MLLLGAAGCEEAAPVDDRFDALKPGALVPLGGTVTIGGKPVRGVVITFLPPSGAGVANGETDQYGKYELKTMGRSGALPGGYRVAVSYLVSAQGEPQGLGARSALAPGPAMLSAKEQLPPEYSDLGRTRLSATVGRQGGQGGPFDFDIPVQLPALEKKPAEGKPTQSPGTKGPAPGADSQPPGPTAAELKKE